MSIKTFCIFFLAVALFAAVLHFGYQIRPEGDQLYHFGHAEIYLENGIFNSSFPWLPYSVIGKYGGDIWYGFHLLLVPFAFFPDPILGLRFAGIFVTSLLLLIFYWALNRLGVEKKYIWPFLFLLSGFFALFHLTTLRPHVLSLAFNILVFSFAVSGGVWGVLGASFAVAFLHLSLFWSTLLILGILAVSKFISEKSFDFRIILFSIAGLVLGWAFRPNPLGAANLAYIQIVELMLAKSRGIPLNFGLELYPLGWQTFYLFLPFMILWALAIYVFLKQPQKGLILWSSFSLSAVFFLMTVFVAQRSFDYWIAFGVIFIVFVYPYAKKFGMWGLSAGIIIAIFMVGQSLYQNDRFLKTADWAPDRFQKAGEWLKTNSRPGDIVFNASWDYFPELFFWNSRNFYISGMDPIFQYAFDRKLYWEAYYLETGKTTGFTCPDTACDEKDLKDTYAVLKNDFKARFLVLAKPEHESLYKYLLGDVRFLLKNETPRSAVFELSRYD